jgi:predicted regulator of Ras-like GTPase activity (Roadblock/LC7/MglB family)
MEAILREINDVIGVTGSFVCLNDASIAAQAVPVSFSPAEITLAARIAAQTFVALETSGQRVTEADLTFERARLILKSLRGGVLVILCARNINLPLLNLTANAATRKLIEQLKPVKPLAATPTIAPPVTFAPEPALAATPPPVIPAPEPPVPVFPAPTVPTAPSLSAPIRLSFADLESEWQRIMDAAAAANITLRVMSSLATWVTCPYARALLTLPEKKHLEFAARAAQRAVIQRVFESLGYRTDQSLDEFRGSPRFNFAHSPREVTVEIHLDTFAMYHQLDLTPFLAHPGATLAETALLLLRLQLVEMPEAGLREMSALLNDHPVSLHAAPGKIDLLPITRLCADQWGWYKTVTLNLQRLTVFSAQSLPSDRKTVIAERAGRIFQAIEDAPKGLRWQTRARVGESMRWYDIPAAATLEQQRPELRYGD